MGWFVSDEREAVEGLECRCPGAPHPDGDTIWLRRELTPQGMLAAMAEISVEDEELLTKGLGWTYVINGIVDWTLEDNGVKVPCTQQNIRRLTWEAIYPVAQRASELYSEALFRPLVARASRSSRNGRTRALTSASTASSSKRPKP